MKTISSRAVFVPATLLLLALSACGGAGSDSEPAGDTTPPPAESSDGTDAASTDQAAAGTAVNIKNSRYDPGEIDVSVGDSVTFTNSDAFAHTVTSKEGQAFEFASGKFADGETFELTFDEAGTFAYFCEIHPTMKATVNVT